ncbi:DegV family protein [Mycobacterium interjectum]|uniref:DegV family protein n=1 Tax=Mycobacterium interjectum TaxID=33895 RepID=UPI00082C9DBF|nr:DegV family protein [Mycobacterium interjectum]
MGVVVVTDASSRLPADLLEKWSIRVVPLHILLDGRDLRDGIDDVPEDIYQRHATTAAATPAELANAYQQALTDSGGDGVVAVHISSALSGTCGAAQRTAADLDPNVRVVDSRSAAMGTGFVALAAAAMIDRVCEVVGEAPAALAVHHVANPDGAKEVAAALAERLPACEPAIITPLGPVLALHVGAGAVAVCVELPES